MIGLKKALCRTIVMVLIIWGTAALAASPLITNLEVQQRPGSALVDISFDLADDGGGPILMVPMLSLDGGATYTVRCDSISGDFYTTPGNDKLITWDPRGQLPDFVGDRCRIRLFALDDGTGINLSFFRLDGGTPVPLAQGEPDTVGFGQPYAFMWAGSAKLVDGLDPVVLAEMDTIAPHDDGLYGFKWRDRGEICIPQLEDCWQPRYFDESTGDSVSYFAPVQSLHLANDGSSESIFGRRLASGVTTIDVTARDLLLEDLHPSFGQFDLVVNYDPETYLLNGETDFAHPEDGEVYPYYVLLNDPQQIHHPFVAGDRIPDRSYVVFKGLFRDDPRDMVLDPGYEMGSVCVVDGVRANYTGGTYSFSTGASAVDTEPDWPAGIDGWAADTLGFLVGPRTQFTFKMQGVDEHGRRDGTPATLEFEVGYPPCVQCVELLADAGQPSAYAPDLECHDGVQAHPCFSGDVTEFYIAGMGASYAPGREYLTQAFEMRYLAIHKETLQAEYMDEMPDPEFYYGIECRTYRFSALLHGQDDQREAWQSSLLRTMAWHYQVDYDCDPYNSIHDGGGEDFINWPTWGAEFGAPGLEIDPYSGVWRLTMDVILPTQLVTQGSQLFKIILQFTVTDGDAELAEDVFNICTRQLGEGKVRALALDQTRCDFWPARPGKYHLFHGVRPSVSDPGTGTWRDCSVTFPGITQSLDLSRAAMASHLPSEAVEVPFRILLDESAGDLGCDPGSLKGAAVQKAWHER
jgi:hypothetical protein